MVGSKDTVMHLVAKGRAESSLQPLKVSKTGSMSSITFSLTVSIKTGSVFSTNPVLYIIFKIIDELSEMIQEYSLLGFLLTPKEIRE